MQVPHGGRAETPASAKEYGGEFACQTGQNWWDEDDSANRANREFNNLRGLRAERTSESRRQMMPIVPDGGFKKPALEFPTGRFQYAKR